MAASPLSKVVQHLRSLALLPDAPGLTDRQLLEHFIAYHDETAFTALVRGHGPMVWGVCRRVLGNHHDAEDAFQATFLVLIHKAASLASRELVANWLFGVAPTGPRSSQRRWLADNSSAKRKLPGSMTPNPGNRAFCRSWNHCSIKNWKGCPISTARCCCFATWREKPAKKQLANLACRRERLPASWRGQERCWRNGCEAAGSL